MDTKITDRKFDYFDMIQRNIGIMKRNEQESLRNKSLAVIGLGGIGSLQAILACKVGFGKIVVIDYDSYDVTNLNRQELADLDCLGMKKADAAKQLLPLYNPFIEVVAYNVKINDVKQCKELIKDVDIVTVAVDNLATRIVCQRAARELGILCVTAGPMGWKMMCTTYKPDGLTYEQIVCPEIVGKEIDNKTKEILNLNEKKLFGLSGGFTPEGAMDFLEGGKMKAIGFTTNFAASYAVNQIVKIAINRGKIHIFPEIFTCNLLDGKEWDLNEKVEITKQIGEMVAQGDLENAKLLLAKQLCITEVKDSFVKKVFADE